MNTHDRNRGVFAPDDGAEPHQPDQTVPQTYALDDYASFDPPSDEPVISGAELRRRLITPEALAALEVDTPKPSLLERLLERLLKRVRPRR